MSLNTSKPMRRPGSLSSLGSRLAKREVEQEAEGSEVFSERELHKTFLKKKTSIPSRIWRRKRNPTTPTAGSLSRSSNNTSSEIPQMVLFRRNSFENTPPSDGATIFSLLETLVNEINTLQNVGASTELAQKTCQRVEEALARRLADAQTIESFTSRLLEGKKNHTQNLVKSIESTREQSSLLSRKIMQVHEDTWTLKQSLAEAEEQLKQSQEKQASEEKLLPLLRLSSSNAVEEILNLESCINAELNCQARLESLMHFIAKDIRYVCRLKSLQGAINQSIRVALTPPYAIESSQPAASVKSTTLSSVNESPLEHNFDIFYSIDNTSYPKAKGAQEDLSSEKPFGEHDPILPVSGIPTSWLKMKPSQRSASTTADTNSVQCADLPALSVPFDRIIDFDPARRPHELLVTNWKALKVPDIDLTSSPLGMESNTCVYPDAFEHQQIEDMTSAFVDDFLQPLFSSGFARPKIAGVISVGSRESCHLETLWGTNHPCCIVQQPLVQESSYSSHIHHQCQRKILGIIEIVSRSVFKAQQEWKNHFTNSADSRKSSFCVEAYFEAARIQDTDSLSTCQSGSTPLMTSDADISSEIAASQKELTEASVEFLKSLQSQHSMPGMSLHREQQAERPSSLSPNRIFQLFPPQKNIGIPRLQLSSSQKNIDDIDKSHNMNVRTPYTARQSKTQQATELNFSCITRQITHRHTKFGDLSSVRKSLEPQFKSYTNAQRLMGDIEKISCSIINSISGVTEDVTLTLIVCGLLLPASLNPKNFSQETKWPVVGEPTLDDVLHELLVFPKNSAVTSPPSTTLRKKKRDQQQILFTDDEGHCEESNDDESHDDMDSMSSWPLFKKKVHLLMVPLPKTSLGKLFRYFSLCALSPEVKDSTDYAFKVKEDRTLNGCKGCLILICHMLFPYSNLLSEYKLLRALHCLLFYNVALKKMAEESLVHALTHEQGQDLAFNCFVDAALDSSSFSDLSFV